MNQESLLEIGRLVYVNYGPLSENIAVVVDIINENKVVVDGPGLGVKRQVLSTKRLEVTKFKLSEYKKTMKQTELKQLIEKSDLKNKFYSSGTGKKIKKQRIRKQLTDFERFKVMVLKRKLARTVRTYVNKNKKALLAK